MKQLWTQSVFRDITRAGLLSAVLACVRLAALSLAIVTGARALDALLAGQPPHHELWFGLAWLVLAGLTWPCTIIVGVAAQRKQERLVRLSLAADSLSQDVDSAPADAQRVTDTTVTLTKAATYQTGFLGSYLSVFCAPLCVLAVISWAISWQAALILGLCASAIVLILAVAKRQLKSAGRAYGMASARLAQAFLEAMRNLPAVVLLNGAAQERERLRELAETMRREIMRLLARNQLLIAITDITFGLASLSAAALLATHELRAGRLSVASAVALVLLAKLMADPIERMGRSFYVGLAGKQALLRIRELLSAAHETRPHDRGAELQVSSQSIGTTSEPLTIRVNGLSVSRGDRTVVDGVSLDVEAGTHLAVVGPSGGGKSSLALAVTGLLAYQGEISYEDPHTGIQLSASHAGQRGLCTYVGQSATVFSGTVAHNLQLAAPAAQPAHMWEVLAELGLDSVLRAGQGLDTVISQDRDVLSGGQLQRLACARTLLRPAAVVVLDEPTAHLDAQHAALVRAAFLRRDWTIIEITHRLSEAATAQSVAVLADGRLVDFGSPDHVRAREGYFRAGSDL